MNEQVSQHTTIDTQQDELGELFLRTPLLEDADPERLRQRLRAYYLSVWERYELLYKCLNCDEAFVEKPISLRHPLIFYLGHTATFFINKLSLTDLLDERVNEHFEAVFAVGVDEMSWDDLDEANYDWPTVAEVFAYRDKVRAVVLDIIDNAPLESPIRWDGLRKSGWWAIIMGIEHELIHLETSSVLIRQQKLEWVSPHPAWEPCREDAPAPKNELVEVAGGEVRLGKARDSRIYGWDNEYGEHQARVASFEASRFLVSNQEFLGFIQADGYLNAEFWSEEGADWLAFSKRRHPEFWRKKEGGWQLRLMCEEVEMPWSWPVEVNFHEAEAFCRWKAEETGLPIRLPTEDEWYRLHQVADVEERPQERWHANIHLDHWASSCPVDRFEHGEFFDVVGNVWQWTQTPIYPFEGFQVHPLYDDFSVPTFDGKHNLIKGGSWISCGNESQLSSRYAFRRHFFQHAGFRYVSGKLRRTAPVSHYETDQLMSEYAEMHYGATYFGVPNFAKSLVELVMERMEGRPTRRAMDLGCASGRAAFELARHFDHVVGVDFSARFINQGVQLGREGMLHYVLVDEGELVDFKTRTLAELGLEGVEPPEFFQGDACNLKPQFKEYDLVFAANLIDRLYAPAKFLQDIHTRVVSGGLLMLASPYTWLQEHTPREEWIGGFKKNGENFRTLDGLKLYLEPHFKLVEPPQDVPFVIRETSRKFQHTLSQVTIWERR